MSPDPPGDFKKEADLKEQFLLRAADDLSSLGEDVTNEVSNANEDIENSHIRGSVLERKSA